MRYFDCHSHFSTKAGLHHRSMEEYENAQRIFKRKREFETEEQMATTFRSRGVRTILDIYRTWRMTDEDEIRASNDYALAFARANPDIVYGNWLAAAGSGDFGYSRTFNKPVLEVMGPYLGRTALLIRPAA